MYSWQLIYSLAEKQYRTRTELCAPATEWYTFTLYIAMFMGSEARDNTVLLWWGTHQLAYFICLSTLDHTSPILHAVTNNRLHSFFFHAMRTLCMCTWPVKFGRVGRTMVEKDKTIGLTKKFFWGVALTTMGDEFWYTFCGQWYNKLEHSLAAKEFRRSWRFSDGEITTSSSFNWRCNPGS